MKVEPTHKVAIKTVKRGDKNVNRKHSDNSKGERKVRKGT